MSAGLAIDPALLLASGLLIAGVMVAGLIQRLQVPGALLFLALGMLVGEDGLGLQLDDLQLVQNLGVVALIIILFEGGLTTKPTDLRRAVLSGGAMATVGVLVTAGITGLGVLLLLDVHPLTALLLGAIVASTDAAAVFSTLRTTRLPPRLAAVLKFESGANDPFAVVLVIGLVELWREAPTAAEMLAFGAAQLIGGLVVGGMVAAAGTWLLRRVRLPAEGLYPVLAFAVAGLSYALAARVGGSGFLAVYVCGIVIGAQVRRRRRGIRDFHEGLANAAEIGLFLVLGLLVTPTELPGVVVPGLAVAAVLTFVARPVATVLCLAPARHPIRDQALVAWAGLRGAVPIVLSTFPLIAGYPNANVIFNVVFFVVLVSTLVQGATVGPVASWLGVTTDRPSWAPVAEALPIDEVEADIVEVILTADLPVVGQAVRDVPLGPGMLLATLVRDEKVVVPRGDTILADGDLLLVVVQDPELSAERVTAWARGELRPSVPSADWPPWAAFLEAEEVDAAPASVTTESPGTGAAAAARADLGEDESGADDPARRAGPGDGGGLVEGGSVDRGGPVDGDGPQAGPPV